jgi:hypothetical protein
MSVIGNQVKEVMQRGLINFAKDHNCQPSDVQIIITRDEVLTAPLYAYSINWEGEPKSVTFNEILRPKFGFDLLQRSEIAAQFIPLKLTQISRDYNVEDDTNIKAVVCCTDAKAENIVVVPFYGNEQIVKDEKPITLELSYLTEF